MSFKECHKISCLGTNPGFVGYFLQFGDLLCVCLQTGEKESKRLQFNTDVVYMFCILDCELCHLGAREGYPLNEALVLQFDQRFPNKTLAYSKLLSNFPFDDLLPALNCACDDSLAQRCHNAGFLGNRFNLLKNRGHMLSGPY